MSGLRSSQVAAAAGVNLQIIAGTLRAAIDANCADLVSCAGDPCCPIPFATLAQEVSTSRRPVGPAG